MFVESVLAKPLISGFDVMGHWAKEINLHGAFQAESRALCSS